MLCILHVMAGLTSMMPIGQMVQMNYSEWEDFKGFKRCKDSEYVDYFYDIFPLRNSKTLHTPSPVLPLTHLSTCHGGARDTGKCVCA